MTFDAGNVVRCPICDRGFDVPDWATPEMEVLCTRAGHWVVVDGDSGRPRSGRVLKALIAGKLDPKAMH